MPGNYGPQGGLGIRVLIVEDDIETRDMLVGHHGSGRVLVSRSDPRQRSADGAG